MTDTSKMPTDLPSMVEQAITGHPGYPEFAAWCESQLIHPSPIYFLIWQASREAMVVELPRDVDQFADDDPGRRAFSLHTNTAYRECRRAIEAQGLKVKP